MLEVKLQHSGVTLIPLLHGFLRIYLAGGILQGALQILIGAGAHEKKVDIGLEFGPEIEGVHTLMFVPAPAFTFEIGKEQITRDPLPQAPDWLPLSKLVRYLTVPAREINLTFALKTLRALHAGAVKCICNGGQDAVVGPGYT